jgi:hypothetical protein
MAFVFLFAFRAQLYSADLWDILVEGFPLFAALQAFDLSTPPNPTVGFHHRRHYK